MDRWTTLRRLALLRSEFQSLAAYCADAADRLDREHATLPSSDAHAARALDECEVWIRQAVGEARHSLNEIDDMLAYVQTPF